MKNISVVFLLLTVLSSSARVSQDIHTDPTTRDLIVVPVRFSDVTNTTTLEFLENRILVEMNGYYQEVSFNKTRITGNILEYWVNIPRNMAYYGNYSNNNHSLGARKLIEDAIRIIDNTTNFSVYRFIMLVHAGDDEACSRNETDILSWGWWDGLGLITNDGLVFQQGAVVSEEDPLGMFCHEFGHILGLPDLYNYNESAITDFVGSWGVMGKGNWNDNGTHPSHPVSWSKIKLGWIDPSQILTVSDRNTVVRVEPLEQSTTEIMVVKIPIISPDVYYLVEVRRRILYDRYLPSEGILVTLINETRASGQGIVKVMDAMNWSTSLDDAAFKVESGWNAVFLDADNNLGIVVLKETGLSFDIHITSYFKGEIAKEGHNALSLAEKQIDVLKDSKFGLIFIPLATINLTLTSGILQEAKKNYESQEYSLALVNANRAVTEALASELRLRYGEINFYYCFTLILVALGVIVLIYLLFKGKLKIKRFLGSRWFYYFVTGVLFIIFNWKILPYLVENGLINVEIGYNLFSEIIGILFTLIVLIAIFELREELRWKKVREKVLDRISTQIRSLFIQVTHLVDFTWSSRPYDILKELNNKEKLEFSGEGKTLLESENLIKSLESLILILSELEEKYYRFLEAELELSLMEVQRLLESLRNRINQYKDELYRKFVIELIQQKEILDTIHAIVREINKIHELGIDFWSRG